ncbi:MAG: hypothetical protein KAS32_26695 [Candidatus Peribacteraceae bacterium]|nr:hypothetical protein [Candidatus Peribacteraceae bacterium]
MAVKQSVNALWRVTPLILGVILLVGIMQVFLPSNVIGSLFHHSLIFDSFIGSAIGSILVGNPITSYVIGGELLIQGVSLTAVTAFIVAWVTVGIVQFPAEAVMLGRRFSILRNGLSFFFSILVAVITVLLFRFL